MSFLKNNLGHMKVNSSFISKKFLVTALMVFIAVGALAQERNRQHRYKDFTPDQIAELLTKQMTLDLELSDKQQKQILKINKKHAIERQQQMEKRKALRDKAQQLSSDDLAKRKSERLDRQIDRQKELKKILTEKQFDTWKKSRKHKAYGIKKRTGKHRMRKDSRGQKRERP